MFTGIVTDTGTVTDVMPNGDLRVCIRPRSPQPGLTIGASVACSGVCLTVIKLHGERPDSFEVQASSETRARTNIKGWSAGNDINIERSVRVGDEIGGHIVSGHVDGVATLLNRTPVRDSIRFELSFPLSLARFIAVKGSVTLDGVSLTVNRVSASRMTVNLIPHTLAVTTLGMATPGDELNLEVDMMARYVDRMLEARR